MKNIKTTRLHKDVEKIKIIECLQKCANLMK